MQQKEKPSNTKKKLNKIPAQVMILKIGQYQDGNFLIQRMGDRFQFVLFRKGSFYQTFIEMKPKKGDKFLSYDDIVEIVKLLEDYVVATVEQLRQNEDPDYKVSGEQEHGSEVLKILEKANAPRIAN